MGKTLDCARCGSEMAPQQRFWCDGCKAYFCPNCVPPTRKCPNCMDNTLEMEVETSRRFRKLLAAIALFMVIIIAGAMAIVISSLGPLEITDISEAAPGKEVRLYGSINSTNLTAFTIVRSGDDWKLGSWSPFLLVDPGNPAHNISVDLASCNDFESSPRYVRGDNIGSYIDGDRITVLGKVDLDGTGTRVIVASAVREEYSKPTSPWFLVPGFVFAIGLMGAMFYHRQWKDARNRRLLHERFLDDKAVGKRPQRPSGAGEQAPRYQYTDKGPVIDTLGEPLRVVWEKHAIYHTRMRNHLIVTIAAAAMSGLIFACWGIFLGFDANIERGTHIVPLVAGAIMAMAVIMIPFSRMFWINMPSEFAITPKGAYFRYPAKKGMLLRVGSVGWDDITDIPNADRALAAEGQTRQYTVIKVGETDVWLDLGKDMQKRFIDEWRRHRPAAEIRLDLEEKRNEQRVKATVQGIEEEGKVEWLASEHDRSKHRSMRRFIIGMYLALAIPMTIIAVYTWDGFFIAVAIIVPLVVALTFWGFERAITFRDLLAIGISREGLHFRYGEGTRTDHQVDFIPWTNIRMVSPPGDPYLQIFPVEKEKEVSASSILGFRHFSVDRYITERISREMELRYSKAHDDDHVAEPPSNVAEMHDNRAFSKARTILRLFVIPIVTATMIGPSIRYYSEFAGVFTIMISSTILLIAFIKVAPENYHRFKNAPEKVGISDMGIHFYFGRRPVPPGSCEFIRWNDLSMIADRYKRDEGFVEPTFEDGEDSTGLFLIKKSGTMRQVGPLDVEIVKKIMARMRSH